jgi:hypothetical protein
MARIPTTETGTERVWIVSARALNVVRARMWAARDDAVRVASLGGLSLCTPVRRQMGLPESGQSGWGGKDQNDQDPCGAPLTKAPLSLKGSAQLGWLAEGSRRLCASSLAAQTPESGTHWTCWIKIFARRWELEILCSLRTSDWTTAVGFHSINGSL